MKARLFTRLWLGILTGILLLFSSFDTPTENPERYYPKSSTSTETLKEQALNILETKCNICHSKQNPFMIFKEKNISQKANNIYQMVFIEQRMPKGDEIRLTKEEYNKLKEWVLTKK